MTTEHKTTPDNNSEWKLPDGFLPLEECVYSQKHISLVKIPHFGYHQEMLFDLREDVPVLPLKTYGVLLRIDDKFNPEYAIDSHNNCFYSYHDVLSKIDAYDLLDIAATDDHNHKELEKICVALGRSASQPYHWEKTALAEGWLPPPGWNKIPTDIKTEELWNLDHTLACFILPRLKAFKERFAGHPGSLTQEQWNEILDKMIYSFETRLKEEYYTNLSITEENKLQEGFKLFGKWFQNLWI